METYNDSGDFDKSPTERLRLVQLLDLDPGIQGKGAAAKKIAILRLGHGGEIEQPMALSLWDARRLTKLLIYALDHHGDPLGQSLYDPVTRNQEHRPSWFEACDPEAKALGDRPDPSRIPRGNAMSAERKVFVKRKLTSQPPMKVQVKISFGTGKPSRQALLHGGYTDGSFTVLLYRIRTQMGIHDGLLWVTPTNEWLGEMEVPEDSCLPLYYWGQFFLLSDGTKLLLGDGTRWSKMSAAEVAQYDGRRLTPSLMAKGRRKRRE